MSLRNLAQCHVSLVACFAHRVLLLGILGGGLLLTGCGGSSDAPQASSSSSADSTATTDPAMMDSSMSEAMMDSSSMSDPAMAQSMEHGSPDAGLDPAQTGSDPSTATSLSEAEIAAMSATSDPAQPGSVAGSETDKAAMLASAEATPSAPVDPNAENAALAASTTDPAVMLAGSSSESAPAAPGSEADRAAFEAGAASSNPGASGEGGGAGQAQEPPADSPDYPAFKLVMGLKDGKHDGLDDLVATRGRGLIEKIRNGSLTTDEKEELKKTFAQPQLAGPPRTIQGSRTVTLNSAGQIITLVSKKQGADWKVSSITIREAAKR